MTAIEESNLEIAQLKETLAVDITELVHKSWDVIFTDGSKTVLGFIVAVPDTYIESRYMRKCVPSTNQLLMCANPFIPYALFTAT